MLLFMGMKPLPKILLALTAVAALSIACPAPVQAVPTTYQYTGNPFTTATGNYTTSDFVSGMLTLAGPLAANMPLTAVTPIAFSFSDGVQTLTQSDVRFPGLFFFATGPSGAITQWEVQLQGFGRGSLINTDDFLRGDLGISGGGSGASEAPGTWTSRSVADTGSTLSLMTLTLMALGVAARHFKRAAA